VAGGGYLERFWERLTAVTPEAMQRAAARVFAERNRTVGWYLPDGPAASGIEARTATATEAAAHA
jgi:predicted Zn-dependent peptidase